MLDKSKYPQGLIDGFSLNGTLYGMPKDFDECAKNGGKLRRKNLKGNRYITICYDKNGKSHAGEVKVNKSKKQSKADKQRKQIEDSRRLAASLENLQEHFNNKYRV